MALSSIFFTGNIVQAYPGWNSRNGSNHPAKGSMRTLVIFAEVTGDPNYHTDTWPWTAGQMPPDADKLFDEKLLTFEGSEVGPVYAPGSPVLKMKPSKRISSFFYEASFGALVVMGDYYPELIQIPYSQIQETSRGYNYNELVLNVLAAKSNPKSKTGLRIPEDFDAWPTSAPYLEKTKQTDGKIDNLIIIWRINSRLTTVNGSGRATGEISSTNHKIQANNLQYVCSYDFLDHSVVPHEFSHRLFGGNEYHNGAANNSLHRYMTDKGGYGMLGGYGANMISCNAWDRYRLGWKKEDNYPDIYVHSLTNEVIDGDIVYRKPTAAELQITSVPTTQEYVLHDFITTGDALRIKLPYLEQGGPNVEPQWIWLENRAKDTGKAYYDKYSGRPRPLGVRINLQVGAEEFNLPNNRSNYYAPFSRFGRWDFDIIRSFVYPSNTANNVGAPQYIPEFDTNVFADIGYMPSSYRYRAYTSSDKSNAFTGNSLSEKLNFDGNGDGMLQDKEVFMMDNVYKDNVSVGVDLPQLGNQYDAFQVGDVLSLSTNPATTPWMTSGGRSGSDGCTGTTTRDNQKIYLNGLKIAIKEKRADGSVVVAVTQGYYTVDKDQRWCGDIVLNERIDLKFNKKIKLALGETPIVRKNPIRINNKKYFTEPTVLTCKRNSVLSLDRQSTIEIDSLCALVLESGCHVKSLGAFIVVKRGGTLVVRQGVDIKNVTLILEKGAYICMENTTGVQLPMTDYGSIAGIHPYVMSRKQLYCGVSTAAPSMQTMHTTPIYQSFFEGNPVYNLVGMNLLSCGYYIPIYRQGLGEDTVVDGILYHKLSVLKYGDWRDEKNYAQVWVRESEAHDKVWVRLPWDVGGQEFLVVDMGLDQGDAFVMDRKSESITLCDTTWDPDGAMIVRYKDTVVFKETCYIVDSVYYLEHPGGVLKHIRLSPQGYNGYTEALESAWTEQCDWQSHHLEFIEGVGSNLGFVYRRLGVSYQDSLWGSLSWRSHEGPTDYIICMERDNAVYYEHPNAECMDCDATVFFHGGGANERMESMSRYLRLTPNPAREEVSLRWTAESPVDGACRITLYDMQGVRLRSYTADRWPYTLRVSDLPSGTYVLRVVPEDASAAWQATVRLMRL